MLQIKLTYIMTFLRKNAFYKFLIGVLEISASSLSKPLVILIWPKGRSWWGLREQDRK